MRQIEKMLQEICADEGWTYASAANGWLIAAGGSWIYGYHFGLNSASADRLCDDKAATYEILSAADLPAVVHEFLLAEDINEAALQQKLSAGNFVLKPNDGTGGRDVYKIENAENLSSALTELTKKYERLTISPFEDIRTEYRVIVLDGNIELLYAKRLTTDSDWKFNLGQGARAEVILSADKILEMLALSAMSTLQLRFASVDIIETADGQRKILEVNSGVMMEKFSGLSAENYQRAKAIYKKAMKKALEI